MDRWARALPGALALVGFISGAALAAGPPFPDPVHDQAVYDTAGILSPDTELRLETTIDRVEADTGAEIVVYTQLDPGITEDENLAKARSLVDQWGIGRSGFDDGLVLMVGMQENLVNGRVSLYGGSGFVSAYAPADALQDIVDADFVPLARNGDLEGATLSTIAAVERRMTPGGRDRLQVLRIANAALGLVGAPLVLAATLGLAWRRWRREGDDPDLTDSPSILMAGPPAGMTPSLSTVVRDGTASQHSINTLLAELASSGRLSFRNLDQVGSARSDESPDRLTDPAIAIHARQPDDDRLPLPHREAWDRLRSLAGGRRLLRRELLWKVNSELRPVRRVLESEAVRLGWLARLPGPSISRMTGVGFLLALLGGAIAWAGLWISMSGAILLGAALVLGGIGTIGFGRAMSQRTRAGAYVDAMLKAYRRTLRKTMEQARSMREVVEQPEVATLAGTPDRVVVWGLALGLQDELAAVLARGLEAERAATGSTVGAYYPGWLDSSPGRTATGGSAGVPSRGAGSVFSASAMPDIGGMFNALGSVGSTPPSSSSDSGGGFGGGGGGGGGGGSGSF